MYVINARFTTPNNRGNYIEGFGKINTGAS